MISLKEPANLISFVALCITILGGTAVYGGTVVNFDKTVNEIKEDLTKVKDSSSQNTKDIAVLINEQKNANNTMTDLKEEISDTNKLLRQILINQSNQ